MPPLQFTINGTAAMLDVPASRFLAEVLRYDLGLTGTKIGCNEAECGACTVLVDDMPVDSCIYPAFKAQGRRVLTIEGLADTVPAGEPGMPQLHPLQRAFVEQGATQCGFCTPGMIMMAKALLDRHPRPGDDDIRHALKDTFCRCTGYTSILAAVRQAAGELHGGAAAPTALPATQPPLAVVGRPLPRPDAMEKVTGAARYTDDYVFPGMLFARTLRSALPHARIQRIDAERARTLPGVHAVLTWQDVPGKPKHGLVELDWPVLVGGPEPARYTGDAVAIVAADTPEIAAAAIGLIDVEYEPLPVIDSPAAALASDAPVLHPQRPTGNLLKHIKVRHGDIAAGFAAADVIVERTYRTPTTEHAFLEPECAIAVPPGVPNPYPPANLSQAAGNGSREHTTAGAHPSTSQHDAVPVVHDKLTIYVGSQIPYADRQQVADCLGLPADEVRVVGTLIGGGFGGKEDIAGQVHVALLARATGRPVKMLYDRAESLRFHPKRHATTIRVKTGATRDGRLVALEAELLGDSGAYASLGEKVMTRATTHATGPYVIPHVKIDCYAMYTNNPPAGAFRGFGVTQSAYAAESNMDILAEALGIDPVELRHRNALRAGSVTATGQRLRESVGLLECLRLVADEIGQPGSLTVPDDKTPYTPETAGRYRRAWGIAAGYKNTGLGGGAPDKAGAEIEVFDDGSVEVRTSSAEIGQGLVGVLAQVTAEELGLPYAQVRVHLSDTDLTPDGGPTTASRQTYVTGNAARLAAASMRARLAAAASERMEVPPDRIFFSEGLLHVTPEPGTDGDAAPRSVPLADAVRWLCEDGGPLQLTVEYWAPATQPLGTGGDMHFAFSYAVHAALVEVDTATGEVKVLRVVSAHDVGRAINPLALTGQIEGGIVMGLGNCLTENYIVQNGIPWTEHLSQYKMPGILHAPRMTTFIVEDATAEGPFGAKGVGEISSIPITPAITNGIYHAVGVRVYSLPVDQDALQGALRGGERELYRGWGIGVGG